MSGFNLSQMSVLAYCNGYTNWHIKADKNTRADLLTPGFFAKASNMVEVGDRMTCSLTNGHMDLIVTDSNATLIRFAILHEVFWS